MKKLFVVAIFLLFNLCAFGENANDTPFFDLTNLTETFLKTEINKNSSKSDLNRAQIFNDAIIKYNQGNVSASYDDCSKIIEMTNTDFGLLNLAKTFYKMGFFSLAENALNKIEQKNEMANLINDLRKASSVKSFNHDDEIYLGKAMSSIMYDNSAEETAFDLNKHDKILEKSDWANYVLSNAYVQMKQYKQALNSINKALSKNQDNNIYILFKLKILTYQNEYKDALKYISKVEKSNYIKIPYEDEFVIQKKTIQQNLIKDQDEKELYQAEIAILKDDIYQAKNILENLIGIDKKNQKATYLLGFCNLKLNNLDEAQNNFKKAYEIKPNSPLALEGMGDIEFINYRYKNALKYYEKSYKKNKNNYVLINKIVLTSVFSQEPEIAVKMAKIYSKKGEAQFYDFYNIGTTTSKYVLKDKINLSDEYIKKSITTNPFWNISWLEFARRELEKGQNGIVQNILDAVYLSKDNNFNYYYTNALLDISNKKYKDALNNLDKAIELNPDFERAKSLKAVLNATL